MSSYSRILLFAYCLYVLEMPSSFPGKRTAMALPTTTVSSSFNVHNVAEATHTSCPSCRNATLKPGASNALLKSAEEGKVTTNAISKRLPSKHLRVSHTSDRSTTSEKDECFYGTGLFISIATMFLISSVYQAPIEVKHILSWYLMFYYVSQVFFHFFLVLRECSFRFMVDINLLLSDLATFANFSLLIALSWSAILSSDLCMGDSYDIWVVRRINGSIRVTTSVPFLRASVLITVLLSCVSMAIIYTMDILTYLHVCTRFCWVIQDKPAPVMFTVTVGIMVFLKLLCFCKTLQINAAGENYSEYAYFVLYLRKTDSTFFCLTVLYYIMLCFNVVVSILGLSWLWTLFIIMFHFEGSVMVVFRWSLATVHSKSLDYIQGLRNGDVKQCACNSPADDKFGESGISARKGYQEI